MAHCCHEIRSQMSNITAASRALAAQKAKVIIPYASSGDRVAVAAVAIHARNCAAGPYID